MVEKLIKDIAGILESLALPILFFGATFDKAIQLAQMKGINNFLALVPEAFISLPYYILIPIILLLVSGGIEMMYNIIKTSKRNKNNG